MVGTFEFIAQPGGSFTALTTGSKTMIDPSKEASREDVEASLARVVDLLSETITEAYNFQHTPTDRWVQRFEWARMAGLMTDANWETWRRALRVHQSIQAGHYRIVLDDIAYQVAALTLLLRQVQRLVEAGAHHDR